MADFFSIDRLIRNFPKILSRFPVTLKIILFATFTGLLLGLVLVAIRIKHIIVLEQITKVYISFMRGTPMIIQMFIVYYGLPALVQLIFHININRWDKLIFVMVAYGLNEAAFLSEIIRSAILAIHVGQIEAGYSVGLTGFQTFFRIVFPQSIQIALPSFGSNFIGLFQGTSTAYLLGIIDIMGKAKTIGSNTHHYLEAYIDVAIIFVVMSILLERIFTYFNKKISYKL